MASLTEQEADELLKDWPFWARPEQLEPAGDEWLYWLYLAGRGAGKTRSGAEWVRESVRRGFGRIGLIAPTAADARDVMVEGSSGLLSVGWQHDKTYSGTFVGLPSYEPSKRRVTWANGAVATLFSAEEPDRLRGPQHERLWCDEMAAWAAAQEAWDMAMFGLRLGTSPRAMITTTPRPIPLLKTLIRDPLTRISKSTTFANKSNLAASFLSKVLAKYEGTRLGRQEIEGELLEDVEGALWTLAQLDKLRTKIAGFGEGRRPEPEDIFRKIPMRRITVNVDPSGTHGDPDDRSDEIGLTVTGLGKDGHGYLLADHSDQYSPDTWGKLTIQLFEKWQADRIVAEANFGGAMVESTIRTAKRSAPVKLVRASRGKVQRAEPVAALYEQGKVHHVGVFRELEDQLCNFTQAGYVGSRSPDRADSAIWGFTELMVDGKQYRMTDVV